MSDPAVFPVHPTQQFCAHNAPVRRPVEIAHFSYSPTRALHHDTSSLKSYHPPSLPASLSGGFDKFVKHDDSIDEHLDGLLAAIEALERRTGCRVKADVVTWRGMVTKFMVLPGDMRNGFEMNVVKFQNTIFIEENHRYKQSTQRRQDARGELMSFWGYKFETLSTLPRNWDDCSRALIESRDTEVVSNEAQFCSIVKTGFGDVRLIIGGEVDAVWNSNPPVPPTAPVYVELKTSRLPTGPRDDVAFERKCLRFWAQSFLLGVQKVVVGYRDDDGVLREVEEMETGRLPARGRGRWDAKVCIGFTAAVLGWVKSVVGEEEGVVWRVRWRGGEGVEMERTGESSFLTEGFVKWREELREREAMVDGGGGGGDGGGEVL